MSPPTATFVVTGLSTAVTRTCMNKPPETKFIISHMRCRLLYTSQKTFFRITPDLLTCHNSSLRTVEEKWGFSQLQNCNTKQVKIRYVHLNALKLPKLKYMIQDVLVQSKNYSKKAWYYRILSWRSDVPLVVYRCPPSCYSPLSVSWRTLSCHTAGLPPVLGGASGADWWRYHHRG